MAKISVSDESSIPRIGTGIAGLDDILYGGLPQGTQNLLIGVGGSGKTLLAFQILYNNAKKGIPSTFLALDQTKDDLIRNATSAFNKCKDLQTLIDNNTLNVVEREMDTEISGRESVTRFLADLIREANSNKSKLIAIDSLSLFRALIEDDRAYTRDVNYICESLHTFGATSLITLEVPPETLPQIPGLFEDSMFDGLIKLSNDIKGGVMQHSCSVVKMRYSKYKSITTQVEVTPTGLVMNVRQASLK